MESPTVDGVIAQIWAAMLRSVYEEEDLMGYIQYALLGEGKNMLECIKCLPIKHVYFVEFFNEVLNAFGPLAVDYKRDKILI